MLENGLEPSETGSRKSSQETIINNQVRPRAESRSVEEGMCLTNVYETKWMGLEKSLHMV